MVPEEENDGLLDAERHQARHTIAPRAQLFPVAEKFVSVNGEGLAAGRPAAFIRFAGCNMWCTYCDTRWANHPLVEVEGWSVPDLAAWVAETGVSCVTLTGGEPLLQPYLPDLVQTLLAVDDPRPLRVEIETNGSRDLSPMAHLREACVEAGLPGSLAFHGGLEDAHGRRGGVRRHAPRELRAAGYARCREVRRGRRGRSGLHGALRRRGGPVGSLRGAGEPGMGRYRAGGDRRLSSSSTASTAPVCSCSCTRSSGPA